MFSSNNPILRKARSVALVITAVSAALNGLLWLYTLIADATDTTRTASQVLAAITVLGGVAMGLLFALAYVLPDRSGATEGV